MSKLSPRTVIESTETIALLAAGSRGDVQPFISLALGLQQQGFGVTLFSYRTFTQLAAAHGVTLFPIDFDLRESNEASPLMQAALDSGNLMQLCEAMEAAQPPELYHAFMTPVLDEIRKSRPTLIIASFLMRLLALGLASEGLPCMWVDAAPMAMTAAYPSFPFDATLPKISELCSRWHLRWVNRLSHEVVCKGVADSLAKATNCERLFRSAHFAAAEEEPGFAQALFDVTAGAVPWPLLVCSSPSFVPPPDDWPSDVHMVGTLDAPSSKQPSDELVRFLAAGPPPVYIGWGSMVAKSGQHMTELACRALYLAGERGVVLQGWARLDPTILDADAPDFAALEAYVRANVLFADELPHEWLFPRCKLTVQHGGAGTTQATLKAGIPTVITPVITDQYTNRRNVRERGVGIGCSRLVDLTAQELASAIARAQGAGVKSRAAQLGEAMRTENGIKAAVERIKEHIAIKVRSGIWRDDFDRAWTSKLV